MALARARWHSKTILALCLLLGSPAFAQQQVWIYKGAPLTGEEVDNDGSFVGAYPAHSDSVSIRITLSQPLAANLTDAIIQPTDWTVTCIYCRNFSANPSVPLGGTGVSSAVFIFSTDAKGQIIAWNFDLSASWQIPNIADGSNTLTSASVDTLTATESIGSHFFTDLLGGNRGVWTRPDAVKVLYCSPGSNKYAVGPPSNTTSSNVSPNPSGSPSICAVPGGEPSAWYVHTTTDGGSTWHWNLFTLAELGLGH